MTDEDVIARASELRTRGMTYRDISVALDISIATAHKYARDGRALRQRIDEGRRSVTPEQISEINRLKSKGVSGTEIAQRVGATVGAVKYYGGRDGRPPAHILFSPGAQDVVVLEDGGRITVSHGRGAQRAREVALAMSRRHRVASHTVGAI